MKIFLTGGTGFIGGAFLRHALAAGHHVLALTRRPATLVHPHLQWLAGSLAAWPVADLAAFQPDVVLHAAWVATPGLYLESPENEQHVRWGQQLALHVAAIGTPRLVVLGTCIEGCSSSAYARSKSQLHAALLAPGFPSLAWVRLFYPYGPGEPPDKFCSATIRQLQQGQTLFLHHPHAIRDYIYIDDLAAALLAVVISPLTGSLDLGTGAGVTIQQLATKIATMLDCPALVQTPSTPPPTSDALVADTTPLQSLRVHPAISLEEGLRRLLSA